MSLLKLYALCQSDYITHKIIHNTNNKYDKSCPHCVNNNTIPKLFSYYGPGLCSKMSFIDYNITYYDTICDRGHMFIASLAFES